MTVSDEELEAYLDGELAPAGVARVDAMVAADVLVAARLERVRSLRAQQRGAPETTFGAASPARIARRRETSGGDATARHDEDPGPSRAARWRPAAVALAAAVALLAVMHGLRSASTDIATQGTGLVARGDLARALDAELASAPTAGTAVAIAHTFRSDDGRLCRAFVARASRTAGIACRDGDRWALPMVSRFDDVAHDIDALPADVQAALDAHRGGEDLDVVQERRARDAGWR